MSRSTLTRAAAVAALLLVLGLAGCGDDDSGGDDVEAYCDYSTSLDETAEGPTEAQFEEISSLAPDEISEQVDLVVADLQEAADAGEDASELDFSDEFFTALEEIEAYEAENCEGGADTTRDTSTDTLVDTTGDTLVIEE